MGSTSRWNLRNRKPASASCAATFRSLLAYVAPLRDAPPRLTGLAGFGSAPVEAAPVEPWRRFDPTRTAMRFYDETHMR